MIPLPDNYRRNISLLFCLALLLAHFVLAGQIVKHGSLAFSRIIMPRLELSFIIDGFALLVSFALSLGIFFIVLSCRDYFEKKEEQDNFYPGIILFNMAVCGAVFSGSLFLTLYFLILALISSLALSGRKSAIGLLGLVFFLAGIIFVSRDHGSGISAYLFLAGLLLISFELLSAGGPLFKLLPLAILMQLAAYLAIRIFNLIVIAAPLFSKITVILGLTIALLGSSAAFWQQNLSKALMYSVFSQFGYLLIFISFGQELLLPAAAYMIAYIIANTGLFLTLAAKERAFSFPGAALAYILCAFSIIGIPPFFGFWPKMAIELSELRTGHIFVPMLSIMVALFSLLYLMRIFNKVFLAGPKAKDTGVLSGRSMVLAALTAGMISLFFGICARLPVNFISGVLK